MSDYYYKAVARALSNKSIVIDLLFSAHASKRLQIKFDVNQLCKKL